MDIGNRRVTRSSINENDIAGGMKRITAGKDAAVGTRRALQDQKNVANRGVKGLSLRAESKKPAAVVPVPQKAAVVAPKPVIRRPDVVLQPNMVGMERELNCAEYFDDSHRYLMSVEQRVVRADGFLADALPVTPKMRSILVDWLLQVHQRFHLLPETLHLTVHLVDSFLSTEKVEKSELQLVGVSCMLVAAKYEELYAPDLTDYEFITDNTFTKKQILRMEMKVLQCVNFDLSRPHSIIFLRWLHLELEISSKQYALAKYFGEVALVEYSLAHLLPSRIAAASLVLASALHGEPVNEKKMCSLLDISSADLKSVVSAMARGIIRQPAQSKLTALKTKYQSAKNMAASSLSADDLAVLDSFV